MDLLERGGPVGGGMRALEARPEQSVALRSVGDPAQMGGGKLAACPRGWRLRCAVSAMFAP